VAAFGEGRLVCETGVAQAARRADRIAGRMAGRSGRRGVGMSRYLFVVEEKRLTDYILV
jgi:hypothetical protein